MSQRYGDQMSSVTAPLGNLVWGIWNDRDKPFWARSDFGLMTEELTYATHQAQGFGLLLIAWSTRLTPGPFIGSSLGNASRACSQQASG
ncbi:hypothetical protein PAXRUDRAFT_15584 [Paxillus rubicundulus Ve08.2h10]|uniref:Uncharacterized protein n=1 Tax=Paxillus rubicundulus Ve08.2h10 TaxID=930991 RepID=A0A0D0DA82_9AGAM|nr:hypothetical protein PAXRUDRAFT_15584 [Paxillus rubicundulus Ve08.2h10]